MTQLPASVSTVSGLGYWPAATDINYFIDECDNSFPPGLRRCVMPAAVDTWLTVLSRWGTMTFREVSESAIELAAEGFAIYPFLHASIVEAAQQLAAWPASAGIFLNDGDVPTVGTRLRQPELAATLKALGDVERSTGGSREDGIQAARDHFYKGDVAEQIASFMSANDGWMTRDDLANFSVEIDDEPPSVNYRGHDVYGCAAWCQGPVALETLSILEGYDLASLGANSTDSLHFIIEALKAAFADREQFVGDPNFIDVPIEGLLSRGYAAQWRDRIRLHKASPGMPEAGNPWQFMGRGDVAARRLPSAFAAAVEPDTSFLCVIDSAGNAMAATPSDGFRRLSDNSWAGFRHFEPRQSILAGSESSISGRSGETPAPHTESRNGVEGWSYLRSLWHARQRYTATSYGPVPGEFTRSSDESAGGGRGSTRCDIFVPALQPPSPIHAGANLCGSTHSGIHYRRTASARSRRTTLATACGASGISMRNCS